MSRDIKVKLEDVQEVRSLLPRWSVSSHRLILPFEKVVRAYIAKQDYSGGHRAIWFKADDYLLLKLTGGNVVEGKQ